MGYYTQISKMKNGGWEFVGQTKYPDELIGDSATYLLEGEDGVSDIAVVNPHVVAVLSSPLCFGDGLFKSEEVDFPDDMAGLPHYVGHPATRALLEALGAEYTPGRWIGPTVGESYIAVPLAQNPREGGWTQDTAVEDVSALRAIRITRLA